MREYLNITNECNMELMKRFPDNHFDLAIVDPPYGMKKNTYGSGSKGVKAEFDCSIENHREWDIAPKKEYFIELQRVSKNQIIFGANYFIENIPNANSSCWIVWDKDNTGDFADCELAWCSFKTSVGQFKWRWNGMLQQNMKDKQKRIHPTEKPYQLYEWILKKYAEPNFNILDTHLGSGSIAIGLDRVNKLEKMNLTLTACELKPKYYKNAINRIEEKTKWNSLF